MNIGVLNDTLEQSHLSVCMTDNINRLYFDNKTGAEFTIFNKYASKTSIPYKFSVFSYKYAWGFYGPVIATSLSSAQVLNKLYKTKNKFLYVWHLEWLYSNLNYNFLKECYRNPSIKLIARNKNYYDILTKCWQKPVAIVEDFDCYGIIETVKRHSE